MTFRRTFPIFLFFMFVVLLAEPVSTVLAVPPVDVNVNVRGSGASTTGGPLTINRIELVFDNGRGEATVPLNGSLGARALINYTGNGVLTGRWVVDGRVIQEVSETLVYGTDIVIETQEVPPLPTYEPGLHSLTFEILNPVPGFTVPTLTYFVEPSPSEAVSTIRLYRPMEGGVYYRHSLYFSWSDPARTGLYRISVKDLEGNEVISAFSETFSYEPGPEMYGKLDQDADYRVQVFSLDQGGRVVGRSDEVGFHVTNDPPPGGVFFIYVMLRDEPIYTPEVRRIQQMIGRSIGPFGEPTGDTVERTTESLNLNAKLSFPAGERVYLMTKIENTTFYEQSGLTVEVYDGEELVARKSLPPLSSDHQVIFTLPWDVPIETRSGTLELVVSKNGETLDTATVSWVSNVEFSLDGLDFEERETLELPVEGQFVYECSYSDDFVGEQVLDVGDARPSPWAKVVSMQVIGGTEGRQNLGEVAQFEASVGDRVRFTAVFEERGIFDDLRRIIERCNGLKRDELLNPLVELVSALRAAKSRKVIGGECVDVRLGDLSGSEACPETFGREYSFSDLNKLSCSCLDSLTEKAVDSIQRIRSSMESPPGELPFRLVVSRVLESGETTDIWESVPITLRRGFAKRRVVASPDWTIPEPGKYAVRIRGVGEATYLYATFPGGLPSILKMGGFELEVLEYENTPKDLEEGLFGRAKVLWKGNEGSEDIVVRFQDLKVVRGGDPLYGIVESGIATLDGNPPVSLRLNGYEILLRSLEINPSGAVADLSFPYPRRRSFFSWGRATIGRSVEFRDVEIHNGGEFIASARFPEDFPDVRPFAGGNPPDPYGDEITLRLAGAYIVLDFSPHLGVSLFTQNADWEGVVLKNGLVRVLVRVHNDSPLTGENEARSGLFEIVETGYIYGRFDQLFVNTDGTVFGGDVGVIPAALATPFSGEEILNRFELVNPAGFTIEITGGSFEIGAGGVTGVDFEGLVYLPGDYSAEPLRFSHLRRMTQEEFGTDYGFITEEIKEGLSSVRFGAYEFTPGSARLVIPGGNSLQQPPRLGVRELREPENFDDAVAIIGGIEANELFGAGAGLFLLDGSMNYPWREVPRAAAASNESGSDGESGAESGQHEEQTGSGGGNYSFMQREKMELGLFILDSEGVKGLWALANDDAVRRIRGFRGVIDALYMYFDGGTLNKSGMIGSIYVPYPVDVSVGFRGSVTIDGELLIPDDGLQVPQFGWLFSYWKMRVYPRKTASGGEPGLLLDEGRIVVRNALMSLEVSEEYGGREFYENELSQMYGKAGRGDLSSNPLASSGNQDEDRGGCFLISLDIYPNGDIGYEGERWKNPSIRPAGSYLTFLGLLFEPDSSEIKLKRYSGPRVRPRQDAPPSPDWLLEINGTVYFSLFFAQRVKIMHTAMGARVRQIEPVRVSLGGPYSGSGSSGPELTSVNLGGVLEISTNLRFLNTYGMTGIIQNRFSRSNPYGNRSEFNEAFKRKVQNFKPFKGFVGDGEIKLLDLLSIKGLAEAGQYTDPQTDQTRVIEKVGVGMGVDLIKGALAALHFKETTIKVAGAGVEAVTGARGLGKKLVDAVVDGAVFVDSLVTTVSIISAEFGATAVSGGATGALSAEAVEELRNLAKNGMALCDSGLDLVKGVYLEGNVVENPRREDPAYVMMEIVDIACEAANIGLSLDNLSQEQMAEWLLQVLDVSIPIMKSMTVVDNSIDEKVDLALDIAHIPVIVTRSILEEGIVNESVVWEAADKLVNVAEFYTELPEVRDRDELRYLPLAVAVADASVEIGRSVNTGQVDPEVMLGLLREILDAICQDPGLVEPFFGESVSERDVKNVLALSKVVSDRVDVFTEGGADPGAIVREIIIPVLETLRNSGPQGLCGSNFDYGPYDSEVKMLFDLSIQVLRGVEEIPKGELQAFRWSMDTLVKIVDAVNHFRPGTVDENVKVAVQGIRDASGELEGSDSNEVKILKMAGDLVPTAKAIAYDVSSDPVVPEIIDIPGAVINGAIPLVEGDRSPPVWIRGSIGVIQEILDLPNPPLNDDTRAGLILTGLSLRLAERVMGGRAGIGEVIFGALKVVEGIYRVYVRGEGLMGVPHYASLNSLPSLTRVLPAQANLGEALGLASAMLRGLLETVKNGGKMGMNAAQRFVADVVSVFSPQVDVTGVLSAVLRALPWSWSLEDVESAYRQSILDLLAAEEENTDSPEIKSAIRKARLSLELPSNVRVGVYLTRGGDGRVKEIRNIDPQGVERILNIEVGTFRVIYPDGHQAHPGGLDEIFDLDVSGYSGMTEEELVGLDLSQVEEDARRRGSLMFRSYKTESGETVTYRSDVNVVTVVGSSLCGSDRPFTIVHLDEGQSPPREGMTLGDISGVILQSVWCDEVVVDGSRTRRQVSYTQGISGVVIKYPEVKKLEVREVDGGKNYRNREEILRDVSSSGLLQYSGSLQIRGTEYMVDYTEGMAALVVKKGRSYDIIEIPDGSISVTSPDEIASLLDGNLLERMRVVSEGDVWVYRPILGVAVHAMVDGRWDLYKMSFDVSQAAVPNPEGELPTGELLAHGFPDGRVIGPNGEDVSGTLTGGVEISSEEGESLIRGSNGNMVARIQNGSIQIVSVAGLEIGLSQVEGGSSSSWRDAEGRHVESTYTDELGRRVGVERVVGDDGSVVEEYSLPDEGETVKTTVTSQGIEVIELKRSDGTLYHIEVSPDRKYIFYDKTPVGGIKVPATDDPEREEKVLFINLAKSLIESALSEPSQDSVNRLMELIAHEQLKKWDIEGLDENVYDTVSRILDSLLRGEMEELKKLSRQTSEVVTWFDFRRHPGKNPPPLQKTLGNILEIIALVQALPDVKYDLDLIKLKLSFAYRNIYLISKAKYASSGSLEDAYNLIMLNADVQLASMILDSDLIFSGDTVSALVGINEACASISQIVQSYERKLEDPDSVFVEEDVRELLSMEAQIELLGCPATPERVTPELANLGYKIVDAVNLAERVIRRIATEEKIEGLTAEKLARIIRENGDYGKRVAYAVLEEVVRALDTPTRTEDFDAMVRLYRIGSRVEELIRPLDVTPLLNDVVSKTKTGWDSVGAEILGSLDFFAGTGVEESISHAVTGEKLLERIPGLELRVDEFKGEVLRRLESIISDKVRTYVNSIRDFTPDNVEALHSSPLVEEIKLLDSISEKFRRSWRDLDVPDSDEAFSLIVSADIQGMSEEPLDEDLRELWFWPEVFNVFGSEESSSIFISWLRAVMNRAVEVVRSDPSRWESSISVIVRIITYSQVMGWDLEGIGFDYTNESLLDVLSPAYLAARDRLESARSASWEQAKEGISKLLAVEAAAQAFGLSLALHSRQEIPEKDIDELMNYIGSILMEFSQEVSRCVVDSSCTRRDLEIAMELEALNESAGPGLSQVYENMQAVMNSYYETLEITPGVVLPSMAVLEKMTRQGPDGREKASQILRDVLRKLGPESDQVEEILLKLSSIAEKLIGVQVGYQMPQPDPLNLVMDEVNAKYRVWVETVLAAGVDEATSGGAFEVEKMIGEMERFASKSADAVGAYVDDLTSSTTEFVPRGPLDRYRAVAEALAPVRNRAGADLLLAYRLASMLPLPSSTDQLEFRTVYIEEVAGFLVDSITGAGSSATRRGVGDITRTPGSLAIRPVQLDLTNLNLRDVLVWALMAICPRPGYSTGQILAENVGEALRRGDTGESLMDDPVGRLSLRVAGAAVDGAVSALYRNLTMQQVDLVEVLEDSVMGLANLEDPRDFWLRVVGRSTYLGIQLSRGERPDSVILKEYLQIVADVLEHPYTENLVGDIPPLPQIHAVLRGISSEALELVEQGRDVVAALALAVAHSAFPRNTLERELSEWTIKFAEWNHEQLLALTEGSADVAEGDSTAGELVDLAGEAASLLDYLVLGSGVPDLVCIFNKYLEIDVPPAVALSPFVVAREAARNFETLVEEPELIAFDVAAGFMNLISRASELSTCPIQAGLPVRDNAVAEFIRNLKYVVNRDGVQPIDLVGIVGINSVGVMEEMGGSTTRPLSRILKIAWCGDESSNCIGDGGVGGIVSSAMRGESVDSMLIDLATELPRMAKETMDIIANLPPDEPLGHMMNLLAGQCSESDVLPPDECSDNDRITNFLLVSLGDLRRIVLRGEHLSREDHLRHPEWGYLKTVPILSYREGSSIPEVAREDINVQELVDEATRDPIKSAKKVMIGGIDLARMGINLISPFPTGPSVDGMAAEVLERSEFGELISTGPFALFAGVAGGLKLTYEPGSRTDVMDLGTNRALDEDLYFELIGRFSVPLLFSAAAQMNLEANAAGQWGLGVRIASNANQVGELFSELGIPLPAEAFFRLIVTPFAWEYGSCMEGYLQSVDGSLYGELYSKFQENFLGIAGLEFKNQAIIARLDKLAESPEMVDVGACGYSSVDIVNVFSSLYKGNVSGGEGEDNIISVEAGSMIYKIGREVGYGGKVSGSFHGGLCLGDACLFEINIDGEIGTNFRAAMTDAPPPVNGGIKLDSNLGGRFSGGGASRLRGWGTILGLRFDRSSSVQYSLFGVENWGSGLYGLRIKFDFGFLGKTWAVITGNGIYVGRGEFPQPGTIVRYSSIEDTPDGPVVIVDEERPVGAWGGWGEAVTLFDNNDACQAMRNILGNYGGVLRGPEVCR